MIDYIKNNKEKIGYLLSVFAFIFYFIYSAKLSFLSGRTAWEDEAHFWTIIQNCSIGQIFSLMKVEGHMMLWYLVVMPFAKLNFPYPITMQIINWLFCTFAIFVFWKKAPFNYYLKAFILLCPVFFSLYAVHARCYSIGICFLFLACTLYKERLKKPYLYFLMLFLSANTSLQGAIGACALGIPFLSELFRNKSYKPAMTILTMTSLTVLMFFFQFYNFELTDYDASDTLIRHNIIAKILGIQKISFKSHSFHTIVEIWIFLITTFILFLKNTKTLFMYLFSFSLCGLFFLIVYSPRPWHEAFFLIYFLVISWIFFLECSSDKYKKVLTFLIFCLFTRLIFIHISPPNGTKLFIESFEIYPELSKGKVFTNISPIGVSVILPQINKQGIYLYDLNGRNLSSYECLKTYFNKQAKEYNPENLKQFLDKEKRNFLITNESIDFSKFKQIKFIPYQHNQYSIYELF